MPSSSSDLAISTVTVYDTPQDSEITFNNFPFKSQNSGSASFPRLLAYRFRAYESVYNAYYRDIRNNPFVVDGRPVYNKWLPTMKGGADETLYELHQCNWERDFLTTAVPNPQQGANAPLVGLTMGDVVTRSEDGIDFYILLPSADMPPSSSNLAISSLTVYDTPQDSEITFNGFPFKSQKSNSTSFPRLLAYRFRAYESVYKAYLS